MIQHNPASLSDHWRNGEPDESVMADAKQYLPTAAERVEAHKAGCTVLGWTGARFTYYCDKCGQPWFWVHMVTCGREPKWQVPSK